MGGFIFWGRCLMSKVGVGGGRGGVMSVCREGVWCGGNN